MGKEKLRPHHRFYNTNEWKRLREVKLLRNPLCERCLINGYVEIATVVHHLTAHKGDRALFYNLDNLQSLCKPHHDGEAQSEEKQGYSRAVNSEGWPIDPRHPMNKYDRRKQMKALALFALASMLVLSTAVQAQVPSQGTCPPPPAYTADQTVGAKIPSLFVLPFSIALTALVAPFSGPRNDMICFTTDVARHAATSNDFGIRGN